MFVICDIIVVIALTLTTVNNVKIVINVMIATIV